ncbi:fimbrial protein [Limoniibacter endophyticus]|uniref:Fimbrial protein n=1 Tax=Limoniibacter endophyticus TaxID=1565040 RepID=A0A8J3DJ29_9HYPH|nr:fimbrial protein [Limoniibacter endophyticus]GHC76653.1 fimbrial protein [Limoniibacter endophyticus]
MTNETDFSDEKPLDPAVENVRRKMIRFMAINLGLLFLALMVVVAALVYKGLSGPVAPTAMAHGRIDLPQGAEIVSQTLDGDRLSLQLRHADGSHSFLIYDVIEGRIISRVTIGGAIPQE